MPKINPSTKVKGKQPIQQPTPPTQEGEETDGLVYGPNDDPNEKDDTELELEKLLFGDDKGFQEGIQEHSKGDDEDEDLEPSKDDTFALNEAESGAEDGIQDVDDADVGNQFCQGHG